MILFTVTYHNNETNQFECLDADLPHFLRALKCDELFITDDKNAGFWIPKDNIRWMKYEKKQEEAPCLKSPSSEAESDSTSSNDQSPKAEK